MKSEDEEKADMGTLEFWMGGNNGVQEGHVDKGRGTLCTTCGHATE
jgi:hypothetical protein